MDQAIALLDESRQQFQRVQDYECTMISQERVHEKLLPVNVMAMKVRQRPFSVYLCWQSPHSARGQEVCYVSGRNQGNLRVHAAGILGVVGFVSIDPHDPRVFAENRHCITDAGLGNLLESTNRYWQKERLLNQTQVNISEVQLEERPCLRIETIHPASSSDSFYAYRCVLLLNKATHLPVGAEAYDWPHKDGPADGQLLERYHFANLRCNLDLDNKSFDH